jgi:hypothetical protein
MLLIQFNSFQLYHSVSTVVLFLFIKSNIDVYRLEILKSPAHITPLEKESW